MLQTHIFVLLMLAPPLAHQGVKVDGRDAYFEVTFPDGGQETIRFQITAFTRVGYDRDQQGVVATLAETGENSRSFSIFFPGKAPGSFSLEGEKGEARIALNAQGVFDQVFAGRLNVEIVEKTRLKGSFTGKVTLAPAGDSTETLTLEGRFLLPAYIR